MIVRNGAEGMDVQFLGTRMNSVWSGGKIVWPTWHETDFFTWANYWDPEGGWPKGWEEWNQQRETWYDPRKEIRFSSWEVLDHTSWASCEAESSADGFTLHMEVLEDRWQMAQDGLIPKDGSDVIWCHVISDPVQVSSRGLWAVTEAYSSTVSCWFWGTTGSAVILIYGAEGEQKHYSGIRHDADGPARIEEFNELDSCMGLHLVGVGGLYAFDKHSFYYALQKYMPDMEQPLVIRILYDVGYSFLTRARPRSAYEEGYHGSGIPEEVTYSAHLEVSEEYRPMPRPDTVAGVLLDYSSGMAIEGGSPMRVLHGGQSVYYMTDTKARTGEQLSLANQLYDAWYWTYRFDMPGLRPGLREAKVEFGGETVLTQRILGDDGPQRLVLRYGIPLKAWQDMQEDEEEPEA